MANGTKNSAAATTTAATAAATRARPGKKNGADDVLVRMYNVGFGDCFLIEFPVNAAGVRRMLIDCGSVAKASLSMSDVVGRIIEDVTDADGTPRIDVVVCTHRHADHVSGFADPRWKTVKVSEVWFPWTENPRDPKAKEIRETQSRLAAALDAHWLTRMQAAPNDRRIEGLREIALNALSNDKAMTLLHKGFLSKPLRRFLSSEGNDREFTTDALPGVRVHVLGPSKDPDIIRDMEPPAGKTYLRQLASDAQPDQAFEPFGDEWLLAPDAYQWSDLAIDDEERELIRRAADEWDPAITVALEKAVNGTSLVLVIEVGEAVLLFPGDAQWSTWNRMLQQPESRALLERVTFWKVGHHGSHNATPKEFVTGALRAGCCSMMSTREGKWDSIPRVPLLDAIRERTTAFARSDQPDEAPAPRFRVLASTFVEARVPTD